jgi:hypothetical protein
MEKARSRGLYLLRGEEKRRNQIEKAHAAAFKPGSLLGDPEIGKNGLKGGEKPKDFAGYPLPPGTTEALLYDEMWRNGRLSS